MRRQSIFGFEPTSRYELVAEIGSGGMGTVFEAIDNDTGARVALKLLETTSPEALLRFKREFRALAGLHHHNVATLGELVETDRGIFYTMELVRGRNFGAYVRSPPERVADPGIGDAQTLPTSATERATSHFAEVGSLPDDQRLRDAAAQLVAAVAAIHEAGLVHRDIKPSNVLVTENGRVVVLDFGLVRVLDTCSNLSEEMLLGTCAYMAPEQIDAQDAGPEADWYAVGVMLYETLTGRLPIDGTTLELLLKKRIERPPAPSELVSGIAPDLDALCCDLLAVDPNQRPGPSEILRRLDRRVRSSVAQLAPREPRQTLFVGREPELAQLDRLSEDAPGIVFVYGESGIGKSALLGRFATALVEHNADALVLRARCYEREDTPYKGIDGIVEGLTEALRAIEGDISELLPADSVYVADIFPALLRLRSVRKLAAQPREELERQARHDRAFVALRGMLTSLARRRRITILMDNMQWATDNSWIRLAEIMVPPGAPSVLVVVALQPGAPSSQLLQLFPQRTAMELAGLSAAEVFSFARQRSTKDGKSIPHATMINEITQETMGHPFFVGQYLDHIECGGELGVSLHALVRAKIATLSPDERDLLQLIAVAGAPLTQKLLIIATASSYVEFNRALAALRSQNFIGASGRRAGDRVQIYHERVRAAALEDVSGEVRGELHRRIAASLEQTGAATYQPSLALYHLQASGNRIRAATFAERAAEHALRSMEFGRAADMWETALDLGTHDAAEVESIQRARAAALVEAGRGAEAAALFVELADRSDGIDSFDYNRRAGEQLLRNGQIAEGVEILRRLLVEFGESMPTTPRGTVARLGWERARLRLRGLRWTERSAEDIEPRDLNRFNLYSALAVGLSGVNHVSSALYQCKQLRLALDLGQRELLIEALAREAVYAALGGSRGRARRLRDQVRELARGGATARSSAYSWFSVFAVAFFNEYDWRATRTALDAAETTLRANSIYGWELDSARLYKCFALLHMGNIRTLSRRLDTYALAAERRGDVYSVVNLRTRLILPCLVMGDVSMCRQLLSETAARWLPWQQGFLTQHFFALHSQCEVDLLAGEPEKAQQRLSEQLPALNSSMLLRVELLRAETFYLRGRVALSSAECANSDTARRRFAREASRVAHKLKKIANVVPKAWAELLASGVARVSGKTASSIAHLRDAIPLLDESGSELYLMIAVELLVRADDSLLGSELEQRLRAWELRTGVLAHSLSPVFIPGWKSGLPG